MRAEYFLPLVIQLACFVPPCYWLLSRSGNADRVLARACLLGFSLSACLVIAPAAAYYLNKDYGLYLAFLVGVPVALGLIHKMSGARGLDTLWSLIFVVFCFAILVVPFQLLFKFLFGL